MTRRRIALWLLLFLLGCAGAELFARQVLGLGDPPLSISDPEIEYLFKPSASYRRFGHVVRYNSWSMRSRQFEKHKSSTTEFRALVLGDSVVNGGAETDQSGVATSLLEDRLRHKLKRPVTIGNVSAGSWGPPNLLAYVQRFGTFDADALVLVFSSHDYADAPTFVPTVGVDPNYPSRRPFSALQELFGRYVPRYLAAVVSPFRVETRSSPTKRDIEWSLDSECRLIRLARERGIPVLVAQHLERHEYGGHEEVGNAAIRETAMRCGAEVLALAPFYEVAMKRGENPYRDEIHPNAEGQRIMADAIGPWLIAHATPVPR